MTPDGPTSFTYAKQYLNMTGTSSYPELSRKAVYGIHEKGADVRTTKHNYIILHVSSPCFFLSLG